MRFATLLTCLWLTASTQAQTLPKVVLLGDSIRMNYAPVVEKLLKDKAIIISPKANGGDSGNVLKNLEAWVIKEKPDIVHFNCGIHDTKKFKATGKFQVSPEQYEANLRKIVERLRKETKADVYFATTTPVVDDRAAKGRVKADYELLEASAAQYNEIAKKVMKELKVPVNDLRRAFPDEKQRLLLVGGDGIHMTPAGTTALANAVVEFLSDKLAK